MKLSTRLAILLPLGIVVILVLEALIFWRSDSILARETTKRIVASELEGVARTGAAFIDPKLHKKVSLGLGHESPEWQQLRAALDLIAKQNDLTPDHCYTFARPTGDHTKLTFAVMLQTPTFEGHVYNLPPANVPLIDLLVLEKRPVSTGIYRDEHGEWISAMAPIMAKDGELTGILEVDYTAREALAKTRSIFFDIRLRLHATMALVALIALVMSLIFAWRWVIRPLGDIQTFADGVAAGRSPEVLRIGARGELAALAGALNLLAERLQIMIKNARDTSTKVASLTTGVAEAARALSQDSTVQARASEQTADFVVRVDETAQVVSKESEQVTNLLIETTSSIQEMMAQVKEIDRSVDSLSESTNVTATSVQEMGTNIAEVAQNAEWLNEQVTDAAASVEEMRQSIGNVEESGGHLLNAAESTSSAISQTMVSIQKVEESARESIRLTELVVADAESGRERVRETMEGAKAAQAAIRRVVEVNSHLEQSGEAIGEILDLIDQVAEQTNVLALNAALIAAEAGNRGKAFGVVAGKIRELSVSTAEKTKDISELVASVNQDVVNATGIARKAERAAAESSDFASEAGNALDQIVRSAKEASNLSSGIAEATVEQIAKGRAIAQAMEQVKQFSSAIGRATAEEGKTSKRLVETMVSAQEKSDLFKRATEELKTGSSQIVEAMDNVTGQVQEISRATDEQAKGGKSILQSMTEMEKTAVKLTDSAGLQSRSSKQAVDAVVEIREIIRRNEQRIKEMDHSLSVLLGESRRLLRDVESISI